MENKTNFTAGSDKQNYIPILFSAVCGNDLIWTLDEQGTLTVSGTGDMYRGEICENCFYRDQIRCVVIEEGVKSIGNGSFRKLKNLREVTIANSVKCIGLLAFSECTSLEKVTLGEKSRLEIFRAFAFADCTALTSIFIPQDVCFIDMHTFDHCAALADVTVAEENKVFASRNGILYDKEMTALLLYPPKKPDVSFTIPDSIEKIGDYAFEDSCVLRQLRIPAGVQKIGAYAFVKSTSLADITIDNPVCEIEDNQHTLASGAVLHGHKNSSAQAYAEKYDCRFVPIQK